MKIDLKRLRLQLGGGIVPEVVTRNRGCFYVSSVSGIFHLHLHGQSTQSASYAAYNWESLRSVAGRMKVRGLADPPRASLRTAMAGQDSLHLHYMLVMLRMDSLE